MRRVLPPGVWRALRITSVALAVAFCAFLVVSPDDGLFVFWVLFIPALPLVFFLAPGLWRNVCPLAATNQLPRTLGFTRGLTLPEPTRGFSFLIAVALFVAIVPARKVLFEESGIALAVLLLLTLLAAFAGGLAFKGKSGWCSSFCPLLPVQRLYGQTPFKVIPNSHCNPCVGCTTNCYDFNPHVAQLADLYDEDARRGAHRKLFAGLFPGLIVAFYTVDAGSGWGVLEMYGTFALFMLASLGVFFALDSVLELTENSLPVLFGAAALNLFYWFTLPRVLDRVADADPWWIVWPGRVVLLALTAVWVVRNVRKERRFLEEVQAPAPVALGAGAAAALDTAAAADRHEVTIEPTDLRIVVANGATLLEVAERHGLPLEAGCRMGVCGSDPVAIAAGGENLSPVGADERATLERLGLADDCRMACCARVLGPVSMSLDTSRREVVPAVATGEGDPSVQRVVVIGNGIAGVTAADHIRRRHPTCEIDMVGRERHPLYNRMAITRLIYGRSAMRGLYLLPDTWYDEQRITAWLNTYVTRIDREKREVVLATRDVLPYDRLILTAGSSSMVPPIEGFGVPGTFVLRTAEDAAAIRSYVQEQGGRRAVVVGGGLLGLEAAYALHKFGLRVTVVNHTARLLGRQLDERGSHFLRRYLEGLGFELVMPAEAEMVEAEGRLEGVRLTDGRTLACDVLLVAAGIVPNVELAREAGLAVGRGVVVDDHMRTSDPAIFAAGDIAEHDAQIWGLWPTAVDQATIAATNAVGGDERYTGTVPVTMLKVSGVDLTSVGRFEPAGPGEVAVVDENEAESRYRKLVLADGRVVGAILVGHTAEAAGVTAAVKEARDVTPFVADLERGDWSVFAGVG